MFSSRCSARTRGSAAAYSSRIRPEPSGSASSTPITSKSVNDWPRTESKQGRNHAREAWQGTTMLNLGTVPSAIQRHPRVQA